MTRYFVFYGGQLYGEYPDWHSFPSYDALPDGVYILEQDRWFLRGFVPVLPENVPKELRTLCLLMRIPT